MSIMSSPGKFQRVIRGTRYVFMQQQGVVVEIFKQILPICYNIMVGLVFIAIISY